MSKEEIHEPTLPNLNAETWELIERRMWDKFKTKIWSLVGLIITLLTIFTAFGITTFINSSIEKTVKEEKEDFVVRTNQMLIDIQLIAYISGLRSDSRLYLDKALILVKKRFEPFMNEKKSNNKYRTLYFHLSKQSFSEMEYSNISLQAAEVLFDGFDRLAPNRENNIHLAESKLRADYPEVLRVIELRGGWGALSQLDIYLRNKLLSESLSSPIEKLRLFERYENTVEPKYLEIINRVYGTSWNKSGTINPKGIVQFESALTQLKLEPLSNDISE
jgi:hypothetical protein